MGERSKMPVLHMINCQQCGELNVWSVSDGYAECARGCGCQATDEEYAAIIEAEVPA